MNRTEAAQKGYGKDTPFNPPNPDVQWLDEHYPTKARFSTNGM